MTVFQFPCKLQKTTADDHRSLLFGEVVQKHELEISKSTGASISPNTSVLRLMIVLVLGIFFLCTPPKLEPPGINLQGHSLYSNGTHDFKRTVILVSIDALRFFCL
jgi:hypothetical protein